MKLIRINSKLFPNRYKKYTNHDLSFGVIGIENDEIKFFLDPRYIEFAEKAGLNFEPYENLPKNNVVLDPWEWSVGEFDSLRLKNYSFEFYEVLGLVAVGRARGNCPAESVGRLRFCYASMTAASSRHGRVICQTAAYRSGRC